MVVPAGERRAQDEEEGTRALQGGDGWSIHYATSQQSRERPAWRSHTDKLQTFLNQTRSKGMWGSQTKRVLEVCHVNRATQTGQRSITKAIC